MEQNQSIYWDSEATNIKKKQKKNDISWQSLKRNDTPNMHYKPSQVPVNVQLNCTLRSSTGQILFCHDNAMSYTGRITQKNNFGIWHLRLHYCLSLTAKRCFDVVKFSTENQTGDFVENFLHQILRNFTPNVLKCWLNFDIFTNNCE